jgi:hypothetical protein
MATKYSMEVLDAENREWTPVALFSDIIPVDTLAEMGRTMWDCVYGAEDVSIIDMDTGEVVWCHTDDTTDDSDWNYNEDMGFDPYMGCYSDDC